MDYICNLLGITGVQFNKLSFRAIEPNPDDHKQISHLQLRLVIPLSLDAGTKGEAIVLIGKN